MNIKRSFFILILILICGASGLLGQAEVGCVLDFPRFDFSGSSGSGIAIFNPTSNSASVSLALTGLDGTQIGTPVDLTIPPLGQLARTREELFGLGNLNSSLRITSSTPGISSFFETFDPAGTFMDGAAAVNQALEQIFPVAASTTEIGLLNTNKRDALVKLRLLSFEGSILGDSVAQVPAFGAFRGSLKILFPAVADFTAASHVIAVSGSRNLFFPPQTFSGISIFSGIPPLSGSGDIAVLNALPVSEIAGSGAIPYLRVGAPFFSILSIANTENAAVNVSVKVINSDGTVFGTRTLAIPPNGGFRQPVESMFPSFAPLNLEGWILIQSSGRIAASVLFGRRDTGALSAVSMQKLPLSSFAFPQIVQGSGFFTELSLANPGTTAGTAQVFVIQPDGTTAASAKVSLPPGGWVSSRLDELMPELLVTPGSVLHVRSSVPLFGTATIWADSGRTAATIAPQPVPDSYSPAPLKSFAVSGIVLFNGTPIKDIPVVLSGPDGILTVKTRDDGTFLCTGLAAGSYSLFVDQYGFQFVPSPTSFTITTESVRQNFQGFTAENALLVVPASIPVGSPDTTVTVYGSNFGNSSKVFVGPVQLQTTLISPAELQAVVPSYLLKTAGNFEIHVTDESGTSEPYPMVAFTQRPQLGGVASTREIVEGSPAATITLSGSGFLEDAKIKINGSSEGIVINRLTDRQIIAVVPASYFEEAGVYPVTVENPFPAQNESNIQLLTVYFPRPALESLDPTTIPEKLEDSSRPVTLQVNGYGFRRGAVVLFDGTPLLTSYCEDSPACLTERLSAVIDPGLLRSNGFKKISVKNPDPSVAPSQILFLRVESLQPTITSVLPGSASPAPILNLPEPNNEYDLPVIVFGTNFDPKVEVRFTPPVGDAMTFSGATEVISSNQLVMNVRISYPDSIGIWTVEVKNPQPGGGLSEPDFFEVTQETFDENPFLISISPDTLPAGGASFTLTVNGVNFVPGSQINFYSNPLPTNFVDHGQVTAEVPASLIKMPGKKPITVTNPDNGGTSNKLFIEIE